MKHWLKLWRKFHIFLSKIERFFLGKERIKKSRFIILKPKDSFPNFFLSPVLIISGYIDSIYIHDAILLRPKYLEQISFMILEFIKFAPESQILIEGLRAIPSKDEFYLSKFTATYEHEIQVLKTIKYLRKLNSQLDINIIVSYF